MVLWRIFMNDEAEFAERVRGDGLLWAKQSGFQDDRHNRADSAFKRTPLSRSLNRLFAVRIRFDDQGQPEQAPLVRKVNSPGRLVHPHRLTRETDFRNF